MAAYVSKKTDSVVKIYSSLEPEFIRECLVLQLDHPNIINFHQIKYVEGEFRIEMPLADDLYWRKPITTTNRRRIIEQLVSAVAYLHFNNVIHGDIKPDNTLFDKKAGRAYLIDFGLAVVNRQGTSAIYYTEGYRPPELFDGGELSRAADVWALGKTFLDIFKKGDQMIDKMIADDPRERPSIEEIRDYYCREKVDRFRQIYPEVYPLRDRRYRSRRRIRRLPLEKYRDLRAQIYLIMLLDVCGDALEHTEVVVNQMYYLVCRILYLIPVIVVVPDVPAIEKILTILNYRLYYMAPQVSSLEGLRNRYVFNCSRLELELAHL